jgi:hypothetical protein
LAGSAAAGGAGLARSSGRVSLTAQRNLSGRAPRPTLLVQQLLDPAQRAAHGLRIGPGAAQRQRGLELRATGSATVCGGFAASRCVPLRSTAFPAPSTSLSHRRRSGMDPLAARRRIQSSCHASDPWGV